MDAGSLDQILKRVGRFPQAVAGHINFKVLQGLVYLKEQCKIIHRDIKVGAPPGINPPPPLTPPGRSPPMCY